MLPLPYIITIPYLYLPSLNVQYYNINTIPNTSNLNTDSLTTYLDIVIIPLNYYKGIQVYP